MARRTASQKARMESTWIACNARPAATPRSAGTPKASSAPAIAACITPTLAGVTRTIPPRFTAIMAVNEAPGRAWMCMACSVRPYAAHWARQFTMANNPGSPSPPPHPNDVHCRADEVRFLRHPPAVRRDGAEQQMPTPRLGDGRNEVHEEGGEEQPAVDAHEGRPRLAPGEVEHDAQRQREPGEPHQPPHPPLHATSSASGRNS